MAPSFVQAAVSLMFVGSVWANNGYAVVLDKRAAPVVPSTLPGTWTYQGCYTDIGDRTLTGTMYASGTNMTDEYCIGYCTQEGYIYAGTEYSSECYCGNKIASAATVAPSTDCSMGCSANTTEVCGGPNRVSVFWNGQSPPPGPQTNPGALEFGFFGCYTEGNGGRALTHGMAVNGGGDAMTVALCVQACKNSGYSMAGVEYASECYCGNALENNPVTALEGLSGCSMTCKGNSSEFCGAGSRLDVYKQGYLGSQSTVASVVVSSTHEHECFYDQLIIIYQNFHDLFFTKFELLKFLELIEFIHPDLYCFFHPEFALVYFFNLVAKQFHFFNQFIVFFKIVNLVDKHLGCREFDFQLVFKPSSIFY
ncbi:WSC domain-containing protein [Halenospora varia]|nr:WSC domain-containing protein [Halenospora varia]